MAGNHRPRWIVFSLQTLLVLIAVLAMALWIDRSRQPELIPIVVADDAVFEQSELILISPRLPFALDAGSEPPPDTASLQGKMVMSVRGAELARSVALVLRMDVATPIPLIGDPAADALFHRHPLSLRAGEYELARYDTHGRATQLPTHNVDTIVVRQRLALTQRRNKPASFCLR